jgi:hypothetical protein
VKLLEDVLLANQNTSVATVSLTLLVVLLSNLLQ